VKSLSNEKKIDWEYLNRVIEGSRAGKKPKSEKMGIHIDFGKKTKRPGFSHSATSPKNSQQTQASPHKQTEDVEKLANLKVEGYSDDENEDELDEVEIVKKLEFYHKKSIQMEQIADKVERSFSLTKSATEDKIPELIKRKSSLKQELDN
jgi:hypothetical protein